MPGFDWDTHNVGHIAEHGVTPEQVEQVVENDPFEVRRYVMENEERYNLLGETEAGSVLGVVATGRKDLVRVVTAFPANRSMRQRYKRLKEARDAEGFGDTELQE